MSWTGCRSPEAPAGGLLRVVPSLRPVPDASRSAQIGGLELTRDRFRLIAPALIEIAILWFAILGMIAFFLRARRSAGYLQIPYLLWVTFASVLSAAIWKSN